MALAPGSRLGPYEIIAPLGAGGMGEVYRAKDTRLGRDVAIKVLPEALSANPELRARLEREARTISQLNHPNVCTLFDIGREGDTAYLVMELVEGETLADRLTKGALPAADVLRIGIEIAGALERAHRAGIVHRDLKPGNIMLTKTGAKLMDFGLARGGVLGSGPSNLSQSPTMAAPLTAEGHIVGTFRYMAPEQLEGNEADARSDIWALGCVLYEMATGKPPFEGRSQATLIASIIHTEPTPISQISTLAPAGLDRIVRACLAKEAGDRIQTAHDVRMQLEWLAEPSGPPMTTASGSVIAPAIPAAPARAGVSRRRVGFAALAGAAVMGAVALTARLLTPAPVPNVLRYKIPAPEGVSAINWPRISPDGRTLAFLATDSSGTVRIWVRPMDIDEARPLPTTDGATRMFWAPDSRNLGYMLQGDLRRVSIDGGPSTPVAKVANGSDGSWGDGVVLLDGTVADSIRAVPAAGGDPRPGARIPRGSGEGGIAWPSFLPDGKRFLAVAVSAANPNGTADIRIGRLGDLDTREVGKTDGRAEYADPGYLIFPRENTLMAQRFDAGSGKTLGDPMPLAENIGGMNSGGDYSVSRGGVLVFRVAGTTEGSQLLWVDRNGRPIGAASSVGHFGDVALSPDGHRVAYSLSNGNLSEVWVRDLDRGTDQRVTFEGHFEFNPVWSPDGQRIAYSSDITGNSQTYIRRADGTGDRDSLVAWKGAVFSGPVAWSADGQRLMVRVQMASTGWDLGLYTAPFRDSLKPFMATNFMERWGSISHDGRWIAYESNETGRPEVFVRPADGGAGKWQVSVSGGRYPMWRADDKELFFQAPDLGIMSVPVQPGTSFIAGTPALLFRHELTATGYSGRVWSVTSDGQRFMLSVPTTSGTRPHFDVVVNWPQTLKQR